jgi:hypothetical protein
MRLPGLFLAAMSASFMALAADSPDFTLHEWGTFTSVSGSDGLLLPGLEREEESLPYFVHQHDGMPPKPKGYARPLHNVTVKMETPVIYFYARQPFSAHVHVGFNGGSISQWFPDRSGGETPPAAPLLRMFGATGGDIDFANNYQGGIEWNVQIQPPSADDNAVIFKPGETPTWLYPRQTDASLVRTADGTAEKFLFYRGVGNFPLPVKFTLPEDGTLHMKNFSTETIPAVFIFNHHPGYDGQATFELQEPLKAGEARTVKLAALKSSSNWEHDVYAAMRGALMQAGLYPKEADALLQTWWRSYFERPGLRVFWIVPEKTTDEILPLTVEPPPRKRVRVLVGRSELLTPSFEQELVGQFAPTNSQNQWSDDRYFGAFQARVNALKAAR